MCICICTRYCSWCQLLMFRRVSVIGVPVTVSVSIAVSVHASVCPSTATYDSYHDIQEHYRRTTSTAVTILLCQFSIFTTPTTTYTTSTAAIITTTATNIPVAPYSFAVGALRGCPNFFNPIMNNIDATKYPTSHIAKSIIFGCYCQTNLFRRNTFPIWNRFHFSYRL